MRASNILTSVFGETESGRVRLFLQGLISLCSYSKNNTLLILNLMFQITANDKIKVEQLEDFNDKLFILD